MSLNQRLLVRALHGSVADSSATGFLSPPNLLTQRIVNSSGPIRLQVSQARPRAQAGHAPPKACGHSHVVTLSFWCHATCQSLSTKMRGQHLPASHTSATNRQSSRHSLLIKFLNYKRVKNTNSVEKTSQGHIS